MDLLADRATQGLGPEEQKDLEALLEQHPEWDDLSLDLAAAAASIAEIGAGEPLPAHLRARVESDAAAFFSKTGPDSERAGVVVPMPARSSWVQWSGWLAAAACIVVAVLAWWPRQMADPLGAENGPAPLSLAEMRQRLISDGRDTVVVSWASTTDPAGRNARGDIVWSPSRQMGFMRFEGLAANDPRTNEYQLWIFDAARDERYPVDGGVFDVDPVTGDVIVPIDPKLRVLDPKLFAVTVEPPGGVVVSSRDRIVLTAKV